MTDRRSWLLIPVLAVGVAIGFAAGPGAIDPRAMVVAQLGVGVIAGVLVGRWRGARAALGATLLPPIGIALAAAFC